MSADIVLDGVANDEDEFHDAQDDFEDENEPATQIRKTDAKDDDCTEDEIPDITGTENVAGDQMTISVDEIEDIPPTDENNVDETGVPEDYVETQANANEEVDDIPDDIVESADEDAAAKENETAKETEQEAAENQKNEEEPAKEKAASLEEAEPFKDEPAADEEIEQDAADVLSKKTIEEYGLDAKEKPVAEEALAIKQEELAAEEAKQEELPAEEKSAENQHDFQLKEPPKRTRSPNELDAGVEIEVNDEPPQTSKSSENDIQSVTGGSEADGAEKPVENENLRRTSLVSGAAGSGIDSVPQTPKSPAASVPKSPLANGVLPGTPAPATPKSAAALASPHTPKATAGFETPKTKTAFIFEEASPVPTPKSPKKTTFDEDVLSTASSKSKSKSPPKSPRSPRKVRRSRIIKSPEAEPEPEEPLEVEPEAETPAGEESQAAEESKLVEIEEEQQAPSSEKQESAAEAESEEVVEKTKNELDTETEAPITRSRARIQSPSSPRGDTNSASRVPAPHDYIPYDQDSHREVVPPHLPTSTSVSSWTASDRESYQAISPWVDYSSKYRSEHTTGVPSHTPSYTAMFDDIVNIGPFSSNLYATSRLLERSRSRTRQRRSAMRSQRASSNYYRFASQFPPPLRTRDYSTPPISTFNKAPSRAGSFISFMEFSAAKNFDLARSRGSLYDSNQALSRTSSRGDIDYYLGAGRISRVDSYVNNLNSRYEWHVPSNYETYRSASRSRNAAYTPINEYTSYANPLYEDARRARDTGMIRSMYEGRIDDLQRNLSKERYERDRLRSRYTLVANQLEQACKQMDLLKSSSYALQRSGSTLRTSVYSNFYPYY